MKTNFASVLTVAMITGLVTGSVALAEGDAPAQGGDQQQVSGDKNGCNGKDGAKATATTTTKKSKKSKDGCNGKDGCGQKDKKDSE